MKMTTTLVSVARSLEITRASVPIAGACRVRPSTHTMQKTGAFSLSACIDAE